MTAEDDKDLVRRHFEEIFNQQNLAVYGELMAEDYVEMEPRPLHSLLLEG